MAVVLARGGITDIYQPATHCSFCSKSLQPPFVAWMAKPVNIFICVGCCREYRNGLMADITQVVAIDDLHALGYRGTTLVRERTRKVEEAQRQELTVCGLERESIRIPE